MGKFTRLFALIILLLSTAVYAQYDTIKIWNGLAPGSEAKENKEKWDDSLRVYAVYQPDVTVFLPSGVSAETPGVIICPGGGYRRLVMEKEGYKVARLLNKSGIACFVLKYRLVPEEALEDVQRTVSFVRFNSKKYNLDPNKIGVMGFSAGGHVVGNLSTHYQKTNFTDNIDSVSSRPDFVIGIYPYIEPRDTTPGSQYYFVPFYKLVDKNTPPTFLLHAADDPTVPVEFSLHYFSALKKNHVPAEMHIYEQGGHGFALLENKYPVKTWPGLVVDWMKIRGYLINN